MNIFTQNTKMKKLGILGFGITPGMTCCKCNVDCYAMKGCYRLFANSIQKHWDANLNLTKDLNFVAKIVQTLKRRKAKYIRIHTEGDFYSQAYLFKWMTIARFSPDKIFYTYTKRHDLDFSYLPGNFRIIQSVGGEHDGLINYNLPHVKIFKTKEDLEAAGYADATDSDFVALENVKIGLVEH